MNALVAVASLPASFSNSVLSLENADVIHLEGGRECPRGRRHDMPTRANEWSDRKLDSAAYGCCSTPEILEVRI